VLRRSIAVCFLLSTQACGGSGAIGSAGVAFADTVPIHAIQGSGPSSPLAGEIVLVEGIVTGDFQSNDGDLDDLGGFFLQQQVPDADAASSEAIFVDDNGLGGQDVQRGDRLRVRGLVVEVGGETRIVAEHIARTGRGAVDAMELELPFPMLARNSKGEPVPDLEHLEGMLVRLPQALAVSELYDLERHGELKLSVEGRLRIFTNANLPDVAGYARQQEQNLLRSIVLDDGAEQRYRSPARYLFPDVDARPAYALRAGDSVTGLVGVLRYGRATADEGTETWRLEPVEPPHFRNDNARPALPPLPSGGLRVMGYNAGNFFTTLDTGADICGPRGDSNCRGARTIAEFELQLAKTVSLIRGSDAQIVGLSEIENNGRVALERLTAALNDADGRSAWSYVDTGIIGTDAIRVAFVYDANAVRPLGRHAVLDSSADARYADRRNRPALAQTFVDRGGGGRATVVVNHLKSKSSDCDSDGDPDRNDGQSNCNRTRTLAAKVQAEWLATDPTGSGDPDVLVIGDLNAHLREDPVREFEAAGYANLLWDEIGAEAYSYVFRGQAGALDHALASPSLRSQVRRVLEWHVNADEPAAFDYRLPTGKDAGLIDASTPYRASDHDPVLIDLVLE